MRIAVGSDHPAYHLKEAVKAHLSDRGIDVVDVGTDSTESTHYPKYGAAVGELVADGSVDRGIVMCGTGIGISIAANKIPGVRAALCSHEAHAALSREHNDANVLALGARFTAIEHALSIVDTWLDTKFGGGRHEPRVDMLTALDTRWKSSPKS
ncbi:ribose 5-phosphate isomerase B [Candidatus Poribacteria bacterium]|nr:ribose 5-phosphate isomerase B [Candidatus Poribacteria bacterium]